VRTACATASAQIGVLTSGSTMRDTDAGAVAGSSESANGFAFFRDIVVISGPQLAGRYRLVPTVTIQGTASWDVAGTPGTAGVGIIVNAGDGTTQLQSLHLDASQSSFAHTVVLNAIPFDAGVPFNVMLGFGNAARILKNPPATRNTVVTANYTMRVTGLAVLDGQGHVVANFNVASVSGATYGPAGIQPRAPDPQTFDFVVSGPEQTLIPNGNPWGLVNTPDEGVSYRIMDGEIRMWFVNSINTVLLRGPTFESLIPSPLENGRVVPLLRPSGSGFDADYAGAASVIRAANGRDLLMFYHAEAHPCGYFIPFIMGVGLARSTDGGLTWQRRGQVLSGSETPPSGCNFDVSGAGTPSVVRSRDGKWLYMLFTEAARSKPEFGADATFLARAPIESDGEPGSWLKYANGSFSEAGLGGTPTAVIVPPPPR
jgi:hypothetical protein